MTNRQWIFIQPNDVLMFRDSKPFSAGSNFMARSIFPPTPQTLQGAIRTLIQDQQGIDRSTFQDNAPALGDFRVRGPLVGIDKGGPKGNQVERLFPVPLDIKAYKGQSGFVLAQPSKQETFITEKPFERWLPLSTPTVASTIQVTETTGWLSEQEFQQYLLGECPQQLTSSDAVAVDEDRVGLGLDPSRRAAKDGQFYAARFVRLMPNIGLLAEVDSHAIADSGYLTIGGENRPCHFRTVQLNPLKPPTQSGLLKVILLTPAYFSGGWQPTTGDWSPWMGATAKLISMVLGKPQPISGWDIAKRAPKVLYNYLPAGSVFFFEDATPSGKAFTETPPNELEHSALGFGETAIGTWTYV